MAGEESSALELLAGTLPLNNLQEVGRGVFSTVLKIDGQNLVIKVPAPTATAHHEIERRIYERIQHHPRILNYHGEIDLIDAEPGSLVETQSRKGLVFEYMPRGTLWRAWRASQQFPGLELRWCLDMANALAHIHSRGIVHGDLGIHNILLSNDSPPSLILADFGGSRLDGSPCFNGPSARYRLGGYKIEEIPTHQPTAVSDVFALGMVLYEITTGRQAWADKSHPQILSLIKEKEWPSLAVVAQPELQEIIVKCWTEQYRDGGEVWQNLRALLPYMEY